MKKPALLFVSAALLIVSLVSCSSNTTGVTPPPGVETTELILDGGFEAATNNWTFVGDGIRSKSSTCVKTGAFSGALVAGSRGFATISQTINVSAQGKTSLKYSVRIETNEKPGVVSSTLVVRVNQTVIGTLTTADLRGEHKEYNYDLSKLAGASANIEFAGKFDETIVTKFCIDDVSAINLR
jgi:hypothetical protein